MLRLSLLLPKIHSAHRNGVILGDHAYFPTEIKWPRMEACAPLKCKWEAETNYLVSHYMTSHRILNSSSGLVMYIPLIYLPRLLLVLLFTCCTMVPPDLFSPFQYVPLV